MPDPGPPRAARARAIAGGAARRLARWGPGAAVGLAAAPSVVRLVGDHDRAWPIMVVAFVPVAALALAGATALALALRRWPAAAFGGLALAVNAVWLAPLWAADDPPAGVEIVAMTTNLQYGWGDADQVVAAVRERDVALLGVTELTQEAVAALRAAGLEDLLPHSQLIPDADAHGSGLWSRYPLRSEPAWDGVHRMPGATAAVDGRDVAVRVVHPFRTGRYSAAAYRADYRMLEARMAALPADVPSVVLGDFNATRDHAAFRRLLGERWRDASESAGSGPSLTWSPRYWIPPLMQLDHILISDQFGAAATSTLEIRGSDHSALVARLVLGP